ncbi:hypothetical protein [uncultured Anaerotruncus sp.]|uniref:hypothetical protein n=1 Tax=uncultured Anaerotruncus sp. TaxID=905011 RepID=UPI00280B14C0|nr:hypothetical protein [uncultured Anaerotruncus sp.]
MEQLRTFYEGHRRLVRIAGTLLAGLLILCYLLVFFQRGANLYGTFLRRKASPYSASAWTYSGKSHWGKVRIDIEAVEQNAYRLIYALPGNPERNYLVRFAGAEDRYAERQLVVSSGGVERFRGTYRSDGLFLYNEQGEPMLDVKAFVSHDGENPFAEREPSYYEMAQLASGSGDTVRGNGAILFLALLIAVVWAVDRHWPRLIFDLRHMWWCVGAEPSELFLSAQRFLWVALPILSVFLALLALIIH